MTRPVLLIAGREFRTYVATLSFWLSLAIAPLAAGAALFLSGGHSQALPVSIHGGDIALARLAQSALEEAGRLEDRRFVFGPQGAELVLSRQGPKEVVMTFGDGFPLSPQARTMVGHLIERDMARADAPGTPLVVRETAAGSTAPDAAKLSRLAAMTMLWLTLTGSLGMLLQAIARERANRALESLLASAQGWEIVAGKLVGVGAVSLLILTAWLGSAALISLFVPSGAGVVPAVLAEFARPLTLLRDTAIYLCAFCFYGAATLVLGAVARDGASAQNVARPLFLVLLAAFFVALAAPTGAFSWLVYLPPLTPFLLLVNIPGTVSLMSQAILLCVSLLASAAMVSVAARLLSVGPGIHHIFRRDPGQSQPLV
jgi:ABC-2 type transport system permease protein